MTDLIGEGQLRWLNSHVITYSSWQDDDFGSLEDKDCFIFTTDELGQQGWSNVQCSQEYRFICQDKPGIFSHFDRQIPTKKTIINSYLTLT